MRNIVGKSLPTTVGALFLALVGGSQAKAVPLGTCNTYNECRAKIVTIYALGTSAWVVLEGNLIPPVCTNAGWGHYWALNMNDQSQRTRYATLLAAYLTGQTVEIRSDDSACNISRIGLGEVT